MNDIGVTMKVRFDVTDEELLELLKGNNDVMKTLLKKEVGKELKDLDYCYISGSEIDWLNEPKDFEHGEEDIDFSE